MFLASIFQKSALERLKNGVLTYANDLHLTQNVLPNVEGKEDGETVGVGQRKINLSGELRAKNAILKVKVRS